MTALDSGKCLRAVVNITKAVPPAVPHQAHILSTTKTGAGWLHRITHFSQALQCWMKFHVYLPYEWMSRKRAPAPVLYYLSGLSCTD